MTADHDTSDRVHRALKTDLLTGGFAPGRLQVSQLADRYATSATPVREALLRLVGEGMIEMPSTGGFSAGPIGEAQVRELYELNLRMMLMATAWRGAVPEEPTDDVFAGRGLEPAIDVLFSSLGRSTGNRQFTAIVESINDRMCRIRRAEQIELDGLRREFANLEALVRTGSEEKLRRALRNYHRRRLNRIAGIAERIAIQDADHLRGTARLTDTRHI